MDDVDQSDRMAQVESVLALMEAGSSERSACESSGICRSTFRSAALKFEVADQYARSCEALAQNQVNLLEDAIGDMRSGTIDAAMARVEIDARKWFASKFLPKRYGDKLDLNHGGQNGSNPVVHRIMLVAGDDDSEG